VFMIINGADVSRSAVWMPIILAEIYIFSIGVSLFLSAAFVKYRDISPIWEIILQALFYLTPILYPLTLITNTTLQKLILLNPMAQAIQDARNAIVTPNTLTIAEVYHSPMARVATVAFALLVLVGGILYFKREAKYFAENI
jgi:ABC-2 type transport system permease protein